MINILKNVNNYYDVTVIDEIGDFVSGLIINYEIRKSIDNSLIISGITNEIESTYYFNYMFDIIGNYRLKYITPENYDNGFEQISVTENFISKINNIETNIIDINNELNIINSGITNIDIQENKIKTENQIIYILRLNTQFFKIYNKIYNNNYGLITATIKIYLTEIDLINDINPLKIYNIIVSYDIKENISSIKKLNI
jgi:hypothetical protein